MSQGLFFYLFHPNSKKHPPPKPLCTRVPALPRATGPRPVWSRSLTGIFNFLPSLPVLTTYLFDDSALSCELDSPFRSWSPLDLEPLSVLDNITQCAYRKIVERRRYIWNLLWFPSRIGLIPINGTRSTPFRPLTWYSILDWLEPVFSSMTAPVLQQSCNFGDSPNVYALSRSQTRCTTTGEPALICCGYVSDGYSSTLQESAGSDCAILCGWRDSQLLP